MTDAPKQYRYKHGLTAERRKLASGEECVIVRAPYLTIDGMAMSAEEFERDYEPLPIEQAEGGVIMRIEILMLAIAITIGGVATIFMGLGDMLRNEQIRDLTARVIHLEQPQP